MRAFSSTLIAELRKEVFSIFWLIEIPFSSAYPTRYVDIDIDIHHGGNRYFSYPFKIGDITYTSDMAIDSVNIEVANADLSMSALLLGSDVSGVEATISFGCLDSNYQVLGVKDIFYGEISGWKILRDRSVELTVVNEFMLWRKKTLRIAQSSCPWPFKGIMSDGLVGYWPFDIGSGVVAVDKTQNGNDGVITGSSWAAGRTGKCVKVETGQIVMDVSVSAPLTYIFWFKPSTNTTQTSGIFFRFWQDASNEIAFKLYNPGTPNPYIDPTGYVTQHIHSVYTFLANQWYMAVFKLETGSVQLDIWKDGTIVNTRSYSDAGFASYNFTKLYLYDFGSDCYYDESRLYNVILTQDEITFLYNNPAPDECHYGGVQTWCDQTYERCKVLTNQDNFGGFRFLPYIMEKQIWWGGPKPTD